MTDIDQQAREILAREYEKRSDSVTRQSFARHLRAGDVAGFEEEIAAITAALRAAPKGFTLVPNVPTDAMKDAVESIKMPHAYLRTGVRIADLNERYSAMLSAAPSATNTTANGVKVESK